MVFFIMLVLIKVLLIVISRFQISISPDYEPWLASTIHIFLFLDICQAGPHPQPPSPQPILGDLALKLKQKCEAVEEFYFRINTGHPICFKLYKWKKPKWNSANKWCHKVDAELVELNSVDKLDAIQQVLKNLPHYGNVNIFQGFFFFSLSGCGVCGVCVLGVGVGGESGKYPDLSFHGTLKLHITFWVGFLLIDFTVTAIQNHFNRHSRFRLHLEHVFLNHCVK